MEPLMSHDETAKVLNISPQTLEREVNDGKMTVIWVRGQRRYAPQDVRDYLERNSQSANASKPRSGALAV